MRTSDPLPDTSISTWILRVILGAVFLLTGFVDVLGWLRTDAAFATVGLPPLVRVLVGLIEMVGAGLLLRVGWAEVGSALLAGLMFASALWRLVHGRLQVAALSLLLAGLCLIVFRGGRRHRNWRADSPVDPLHPTGEQ